MNQVEKQIARIKNAIQHNNYVDFEYAIGMGNQQNLSEDQQFIIKQALIDGPGSISWISFILLHDFTQGLPIFKKSLTILENDEYKSYMKNSCFNYEAFNNFINSLSNTRNTIKNIKKIGELLDQILPDIDKSTLTSHLHVILCHIYLYEKINGNFIAVVAEKLIEHGADVNFVNDDSIGDTALMNTILLYENNENVSLANIKTIFQAIFRAGGNPHLTNNANHSAFDLAEGDCLSLLKESIAAHEKEFLSSISSTETVPLSNQKNRL